MNNYLVALTLEVEAADEPDALLLAGNAAVGMRFSPGVEHCSIAREADRLFNDEPFAQLRGQVGFES